MTRVFSDPDAGDDGQPELGFSGIRREAEVREAPAAPSGPPRAAERSDRTGEPARSEFFRAKRGPVLPVIGLVGAVATVAFFLWLGLDEGPPPAAAPADGLAPVAAAPDFEVPFPEVARDAPVVTPSPGSLAAAEPDPSAAPPAALQSGAAASALAAASQVAAQSEPAPAIAKPAAAADRTVEAPAVVRNAFSVQLLAARSEVDVSSSWDKLRGAHPDLLASLSPTVARTERAPGDTFYRLRVGPLRDRSAADALCKALSARQQSCFVVSPGS